MSKLTGNLVVITMLFFSVAVSAIDVQEPFDNPEHAERYDALTKEIRCLVCQNEAIADSTAPLAADLRREVRRMVEEGQTDNEIKDFLVTRYGDFVLYRPQFKATTATLWLAPLGFLLIGAIAFVMVIKRRSAMPSDQDAPLMDDLADDLMDDQVNELDENEIDSKEPSGD